MSIPFSCSHCRCVMNAEDRLAGKKVRCKACQAILVVPAAAGDVTNLAEAPARARPPRKSARSARRGKSSSTWLIVALVGGGLAALGVLAGVIILVVVLSQPGQPGGPPANTNKTTIPLQDVGGFKAPAAAKGKKSYLKVVSTKGDYIGAGQTYEYAGHELTLVPTDRGFEARADQWVLNVGAPKGQGLVAGHYPNARRFAFSDVFAGLEFAGHGRGCNTIEGQFVVWEYEVQGNRVASVAVDFVQHCEGRHNPKLIGTLRYNSSIE